VTGNGKETTIQEFMFRNIMNVEHEMYNHTNNNWRHSNSNKILKESLEAIPVHMQ